MRSAVHHSARHWQKQSGREVLSYKGLHHDLCVRITSADFQMDCTTPQTTPLTTTPPSIMCSELNLSHCLLFSREALGPHILAKSHQHASLSAIGIINHSNTCMHKPPHIPSQTRSLSLSLSPTHTHTDTHILVYFVMYFLTLAQGFCGVWMNWGECTIMFFLPVCVFVCAIPLAC